MRRKPTSRRAEDAYSVRFVCSGTHPKRRKTMRPCSTTSAFFTWRTIASEAEQYLTRGFAARRKQDDIAALGVSQVHLAALALVGHNFKRAENIAAEAQENLTAAGDSGRVGLIGALVTRAYARCEQHKCAEGLRDANMPWTSHASSIQRILCPPVTC